MDGLLTNNRRVIEGSDLNPLLGMAELGDEDRGSHLDERRPDTKYDLAADEHIERCGKELDNNTSDDDDRAQGGRQTTTQLVAYPTEEDERNDAADGV